MNQNQLYGGLISKKDKENNDLVKILRKRRAADRIEHSQAPFHADRKYGYGKKLFKYSRM